MPSFFIKAETIDETFVECDLCDDHATHVEVDYYHNHDSETNLVVCLRCAQREFFEFCPCCAMNDLYECENEAGVIVCLRPAYRCGTLDDEGCCSDHP
jgi:hypothetical protein